MSIFQVIASKEYSTINSLQETLTYVTRVTGTRSSLIYGANVSPFYPFAQMELVKGVYAQEDGKTFYHYVFKILRLLTPWAKRWQTLSPIFTETFK